MKILLRRHRIFGSFEFQLRPIVVSLVNFELASVQIERAVYFVLLTSKIHRNTDIKPISKIFAVSSKVFYQGSLDSSQWRQSLTSGKGSSVKDGFRRGGEKRSVFWTTMLFGKAYEYSYTCGYSPICLNFHLCYNANCYFLTICHTSQKLNRDDVYSCR